MKIAYLILCHKNPKQVATLIRKLNSEDVDFYVHVDKKSTSFILPEQKNVFRISSEDSIDIKWGTNSIVRATLLIVGLALYSNVQYDYFCLLSGQDLPIKSNTEIQRYLELNSGYNFIDIAKRDFLQHRKFCKRNELYYPSWMFDRSFFCKSLKKIYICVSGGYKKTFSLFKRKKSAEINFAFGSQWWCLTRECLRWIFDYLEKNKDIVCFFDNALTPDECVFQTAFINSPFSDTSKGNLTFLLWDSNENNPRVLTKEDYHILKSSEKLFARKFDVDKDEDIIMLLCNENQ